MTALVLKHFDLIRKTILKINFLNYVNDKVLSQYDDEDILHSMIFYNKNMIFTECNYQIYDKELLVTIVSLTTQDIYRDQTVITITRLEI